MVYLEKNARFGQPEAAADEPTRPSTWPSPPATDVPHEGWPGFITLKRRTNRPLEVIDLAPDGPAAQAGILKDDLILAVNGRPIEKLTTAQFVLATIAAPVTLTVKRKTAVLQLTFQTR